MASVTLSLCASLATHCRISLKQTLTSPSISNHDSFNLSFPCPSSPKPFSSSLNFYGRQEFPFLLKSSESDTAVIESEPLTLEPAASQTVEIPSEQAPKREEIFAVVMIGSRQYIVFPGRYIHTQRLKGAAVNDKITLNKVLLVGTKTHTYIGKPVVTNAAVHAIVEEQGLDDKKIVFKYKRKKNYRRNIGHRQPNTRIRVTAITGYQDFPAATLDS